jgi:hypothetical protein
MAMRSDALGKPTSAVEVTNVSTHGFWLLLLDRELFVPFADFPWFKDVGALLKVELPSPRHLYWPDLDIDLAVESLEHPERFPLISRSPTPTKPSAHKS